MKIALDPKQLEDIKSMLDKVVSVAEKIATEMKRANDLKEKELQAAFLSNPFQLDTVAVS